MITGWSALSLLVWATDPAACTPGQNCAGAFAGLSPHPRVGEFVYFVVNALLVNVLPDITAASPVARALFTGIMVSGVALVGRYATALWAEAKELDARKGQIS